MKRKAENLRHEIKRALIVNEVMEKLFKANPRNMSIYLDYLSGSDLKKLSFKHNHTKGRIQEIIRRVEQHLFFSLSMVTFKFEEWDKKNED